MEQLLADATMREHSRRVERISLGRIAERLMRTPKHKRDTLDTEYIPYHLREKPRYPSVY